MRQIPLTQGKFALVDDANYDWLKKRKWKAVQRRHTFYAECKVRMANGKQRTEGMHRLILGLQPTDELETDHIDGDGLNNQRSNLRACTVMQNQQSRRKHKVGTSKYKGAFWHRRDRKWRSEIVVNKKQICLGYFDSETDAAWAYNRAALKHFGAFAQTNKI